MTRTRRGLVLLTVLTLCTGGALAKKADLKKLFPTVRGSSGLFNVFHADTLRAGEYTVQFNSHLVHRDVGDISILTYPISFSVGVSDRVEVFASVQVHRRVRNTQLMEFQTNDGGRTPSVLFDGRTGFSNETPYMDVGFGDGFGEMWAGVKVNVISDRRGDGFTFAVQPMARMKTHTNKRNFRTRGLTADSVDIGVVAVLSQSLPAGGAFSAHVGPMFAQDPLGVDRQNWFDMGVGVDVPLGDSPVSFIGELYAQRWFGSKETSQLTNGRSPTELNAGLRGYIGRNVALSGGYTFQANVIDEDTVGIAATDRHGWVAQLAFARKINRAPTIACSPSQVTISKVTPAEVASADLSATWDDEDDDVLAASWTVGSGQLNDQGNNATWNTAGVGYGTYPVRVEVSDGENIASCTIDVTIEKTQMPPTIACEPSSASIVQGQSTTLNARAQDPNGDPLTYAWTVAGQGVTNNQSSFEFGSAGRNVGQHQVGVTVTDSDGMSANCNFAVTVSRVPNVAPTASISVNPTEAFAGETVTATGRCTDPANDPLTMSWVVDGRRRSETGSTLRINTGGMAGGNHTVAVTCTDDRGATDTATASFRITEKIIIPVDRIEPDNKAKAQLDEIALKLQQNPRLRARITGFTDDRGSEEANLRAGTRRAEAARNYLVSEHSIDASRIDVESKGPADPIGDNSTAEGRKQNRRVEVELFVP